MSGAQTQAAKLLAGGNMTVSWYEASARTRLRLLLDAGSLEHRKHVLVRYAPSPAIVVVVLAVVEVR